MKTGWTDLQRFGTRAAVRRHVPGDWMDGLTACFPGGSPPPPPECLVFFLVFVFVFYFLLPWELIRKIV